MADWGRHALTALVAAAWCEAAILAKNASGEASEKKKDREAYFADFFEGVARHPVLLESFQSFGLFPMGAGAGMNVGPDVHVVEMVPEEKAGAQENAAASETTPWETWLRSVLARAK